MRALIIFAGASFLLSACSEKSATESDANIGGNLATVDISSNDTTVIDAATGDAANMAADVSYDEGDLSSTGDVRGDGNVDRQTMNRRRATEKEESATNESTNDSQMETAAETNAN